MPTTKNLTGGRKSEDTPPQWTQSFEMQISLIALNLSASADPGSFVRGGPTLTFFLSLKREGRIQIPLLAGHRRPTSETPFKWRFAGGPIKALH